MTKYLLTAQPESIRHALAEAGSPKVAAMPAPGVAVTEEYTRPVMPIFLRHVHPAQEEIRLSGELRDIGALSAAMKRLLPLLDREKTFSVQTRILEGYEIAYKPFDINSALSGIAEREGLRLDVRAPQQIVSVSITQDTGYLGVSTPEENLSAWTGGMRRFRKEPEQVSRAEFKLLEAIETFNLSLPESGTALDLGAAPGGWTRVLRGKGLRVIAVDPALLDPRVAADPGVTHRRELAQAFYEKEGEKYLDCDEKTRHDALAQFGLSVNIPKMKSDLARYGIQYDQWFFESSLHESGYVADTVAALTDKGYTYEKDGALWLKTAEILAENLRRAGKSDEAIEKLGLKDDVLRRRHRLSPQQIRRPWL